MDLETIRFIAEMALGLFVAPFSAVIWFLMRKLIADVGKIDKVCNDLQLHVALHYVQKEDFSKSLENQKTDFVKALENQKDDLLKALQLQKDDYKAFFEVTLRKLDRIETAMMNRPTQIINNPP